MSAGIKVAAQGNGYGAIPGLNNVSLGAYTSAGQLSAIEEITHMSKRGLSIRIVPASGGTIVSIRDEGFGISGEGELHLIHEDQDLGTELGKIITLHYLKK